MDNLNLINPSRFNKSNYLVFAEKPVSLTITQLKLYMSILVQFQNALKRELNNFKEKEKIKKMTIEKNKEELTDFVENIRNIKIPAYALRSLANITTIDNKHLKKNLETLVGLQLKYFLKTRKTKSKETNWGVVPWLGGVEYIDNVFYFTLHPVIKILLLEEEFYTPLDLQLLRNFKYTGTFCVYEFIKAYANNNAIPKLTIEELKKMLGISLKSKVYNNFYKIELNYIKKAVLELKEKANLNLSYLKLNSFGEEIKQKNKGKICYIQFYLEKKLQQKTKNKEDVGEIKNLLELIPEKEQTKSLIKNIENLIEKYNLDFVKNRILYTNNKKTGKGSYLAYLKKCATTEEFEAFISKQKEEIENKKIIEKKRIEMNKEEEKEKRIKMLIEHVPVAKIEEIIENFIDSAKGVKFMYKRLLKKDRLQAFNFIKQQIILAFFINPEEEEIIENFAKWDTKTLDVLFKKTRDIYIEKALERKQKNFFD